jgi:hypothetical protein
MKIFFIITLGCSGSRSIAQYFGFEHESPDNFYPNIDELKKRIEIAKPRGYFGKVSHYYIGIIQELQKEFPNAFFIHSIRNGEKVITSFARKVLVEPLVYLGLEERINGFYKMSQFQKLCWMWRYWNEEADKYIPIRVKFEDYCRILPKTNVSSRPGKVRKPWSAAKKKIFKEICGDLMTKYNYKI